MYVENMAPSVSVALPECENRPDIVEREGSRRWKLRREIIMDEILVKVNLRRMIWGAWDVHVREGGRGPACVWLSNVS
jgi:hypothetical protein